jgi:hypothetical protein
VTRSFNGARTARSKAPPDPYPIFLIIGPFTLVAKGPFLFLYLATAPFPARNIDQRV